MYISTAITNTYLAAQGTRYNNGDYLYHIARTFIQTNFNDNYTYVSLSSMFLYLSSISIFHQCFSIINFSVIKLCLPRPSTISCLSHCGKENDLRKLVSLSPNRAPGVLFGRGTLSTYNCKQGVIFGILLFIGILLFYHHRHRHSHYSPLLANAAHRPTTFEWVQLNEW